jgi:hypothetical protein
VQIHFGNAISTGAAALPHVAIHLPSQFESFLFMFGGATGGYVAAVPRAHGRVQKPIPTESNVL